MPASPCAAEFYEIWQTRSTHRHNHVCQIFSRSVQGLRSSDIPKLPFPVDLQRRPNNSVALPCDTVMRVKMLVANRKKQGSADSSAFLNRILQQSADTARAQSEGELSAARGPSLKHVRMKGPLSVCRSFGYYAFLNSFYTAR